MHCRVFQTGYIALQGHSDRYLRAVRVIQTGRASLFMSFRQVVLRSMCHSGRLDSGK